MWSAIQSDLFEFVSTVQNDTKKTLDTVLGAEEEKDAEEEYERRQLQDLRRSYGTYREPVEDTCRKEYESFRSSFTLSSQAVDIGSILDEEPDVARYYAELVPATMVPEEFWGRYFFKLKLMLRGAANPLDVLDEDEEIGWETNDAPEEERGSVTDTGEVKPPSAVSSQDTLSSVAPDPEKEMMRKQVRVLVARVSELERSLAAANEELAAYKSKEADGSAVAAVEEKRAPSEPSPLSDTREDSVVEGSSAVLSPFESESNTDTSNHGAAEHEAASTGSVKGADSVGRSKEVSQTSLANLDDEEWEEDNGWS